MSTICDSPFVKTVFPACSLVEGRRMIQAVIVFVIILIIGLLIMPMIPGIERNWMTWLYTIGTGALLGFVAYRLDVAGRVLTSSVPGSYTVLTTAEELIE